MDEYAKQQIRKVFESLESEWAVLKNRETKDKKFSYTDAIWDLKMILQDDFDIHLKSKTTPNQP